MGNTLSINLPTYSFALPRFGRNKLLRAGIQAQPVRAHYTKTEGNLHYYSCDNGDELVICTPRSRLPSRCSCQYVLRAVQAIRDPKRLSRQLKLIWLRHPLDKWPSLPQEISESWEHQFRFVGENVATDTPGLRPPQLGAIHAVAAHLIVSTKPCTVVMPTGTGKTDTMIALLVYLRCSQVLLIVPNDVLRSQSASEFMELGCLREVQAVSAATAGPIVGLLRKGIQRRAEARSLTRAANVLITTPQILKNCSTEAMAEIVSSTSHLFIDEAHHIAAPTWAEIRSAFEDKPTVQFTATPYRRDGRLVDGKIVFNYPLGRAQEDGYFRHIDLLEIEEYDEEKVDEHIALKAIERLREDEKNGFNHLILARTKPRSQAEKLAQLYRVLAPDLHAVAIYSGLPVAEKKERLASIESGKSKILVCVDMFGEGFNQPNLKIAAMHKIHKSLPITVQFIGRFTRHAKGVGDASIVLNLADPQVSSDLQSFYSFGADWNAVLRRKSETVIEREISLQDLIESFKGTLPKHLPLWNLRPGLSTVLFSSDAPKWSSTTFAESLPESAECWHAVSDKDRTAIAVIASENEVKWGKYRDIKDLQWTLVLAYWNEDKNLLFIYSSDYDAVNCDAIAKSLLGSDVKPVTGQPVFRIFSDVKRPMVRNLGAAKSGSVRYTMYFGPDVTEGLSQIEKASSEVSNLFGWGFESGNRVTFGCSVRKGKIWSHSGGSIACWRSWCDAIGEKLNNSSLDFATLLKDFLRPEELHDRYQSAPLYIEWGEGILKSVEQRVKIFFGKVECALTEVDLTVTEFSDSGPIKFSINSGSLIADYQLKFELSPDGTVVTPVYERVKGPEISIQVGSGQRKTLVERVVRDPLVVTYADGSFSYNEFLVKCTNQGELNKERLNSLEWENIDIKNESQGPERDITSIQHRVCELISEDFELIYNDDASGEAADVIAIKEDSKSKEIFLQLIHCKFSSEDTPGSRIADFYEVCGQAQKCIKWKHGGFRALAEHMRRREQNWNKNGHTRFIKGDLRLLKLLEQISRASRLSLEVTIVQPGLSGGIASVDVLRLLGGTELYLRETADAKFSVICSP